MRLDDGRMQTFCFIHSISSSRSNRYPKKKDDECCSFLSLFLFIFEWNANNFLFPSTSYLNVDSSSSLWWNVSGCVSVQYDGCDWPSHRIIFRFVELMLQLLLLLFGDEEAKKEFLITLKTTANDSVLTMIAL
jgi:hypothetical protein